MYVCMCSRACVTEMWWCCAPRVRAARSQCTSLFYADGRRREHDHCKAQGRLCDTSLLSLTGVIMPSSRPFLVDLPRVAREGPEATPLTSHASTFWLSPSADSQTRNSLKVSQPCGLKNDLLCSRPLRACSHLENREPRNSLKVSQSCGLKNDLLCSRPLRAQQSPGEP